MTRFSRWIGVLEVVGTVFEDTTPLFHAQNDPFVIRFRVKPIVWLERETTIPIHEPRIWKALSFTKNFKREDAGWTGKVRGSLTELSDEDGQFLETALLNQAKKPKQYELSEQDFKRHLPKLMKGPRGQVEVNIPVEEEEKESDTARESIRVQAKLASIGHTMGFKIWIPVSDRSRVEKVLGQNSVHVLETLPLNYEDKTLETIENIDVLWIQGRQIIRAFEVEHTTSIYSGILRMADLRALQPNMDIKFHIVAPEERKRKVFDEIRRPVFAFLDGGALADYCTFIGYGNVEKLAGEKNLKFMKEDVLSVYEERAVDEE